MKVALSASHGGNQKAIELLESCDLIYTTNVRCRDDLYELFGDDVVRFIPDATESMREFLENRHKADEIIGFSDLFALRHYPE